MLRFGRMGVLAAVVCFVAVLARGGVSRASEVVGVAGRVFGPGDRTPGAGVRIVVSDADGRRFDLTTKADGRFSVVGLSPGEVVLIAEKRGLVSQAVICNVSASQSATAEIFMPEPLHAVTRRHSTCTVDPATSDLYIIR